MVLAQHTTCFTMLLNQIRSKQPQHDQVHHRQRSFRYSFLDERFKKCTHATIYLHLMKSHGRSPPTTSTVPSATHTGDAMSVCERVQGRATY